MIYRIISIVNTEEEETKCEISAQGTDAALLFVSAGSLKDAADAITQAEPIAKEAMRKYVQKGSDQEEPEQEQEQNAGHHRKLMPYSIEDAQEFIEDFTNGGRGKTFLKQIDNGRKIDKGSLLYTDLQYLMALSSIDAFDGITAAFYAGVRKGYRKAKKKK